LIAWWLALAGANRLLAVAAVIATVAAPVALWAFDRIRSDLRSGRVIRVTGIPVIEAEADDESPYRVSLNGRQLRVPASAGDILRQPGQTTAFYTPWSAMLVNLAPAED
jgi:hypothetical protein